jgi:hypothetical protein
LPEIFNPTSLNFYQPIAQQKSISWTLDSATLYGDLIESAFDLYRFSLYQSLRFPLPKTIAEEEALGLKVTEYLYRGTYPPGLDFIPDP